MTAVWLSGPAVRLPIGRARVPFGIAATVIAFGLNIRHKCRFRGVEIALMNRCLSSYLRLSSKRPAPYRGQAGYYFGGGCEYYHAAMALGCPMDAVANARQFHSSARLTAPFTALYSRDLSRYPM